MRTVQEVFNDVIDEGFYFDESTYGKSARHMCGALYYAWYNGHITEAEYQRADAEIREYLQDHAFLRYALEVTGLPHEYEDRLAIYRNWANRPKLRGANHAG